jgi:hypothetical protein
LELSTKQDGGSDDAIRPWVQGFVKSMGMPLAQELLENAGLPKNETRQRYDGW